ncbi:MAG: BON domain-containing protein [Pseudomonadota bacterium]|jgi:osmotically-inducible protein OsmY
MANAAGFSAEDHLHAVRAALARSFRPADLKLERLTLDDNDVLLVEGEASGLSAKKRALRIAAIASGAAGVVDRLHVKALRASDRQILDRLGELFASDPRYQDFAVDVDLDPRALVERARPAVAPPAEPLGRLLIEVADGVVTLNGTAPSLVRKRLAGALAWRVAGVRDVVNGLAVEPAEEDGPDELEEAVRQALDGNPLFDDTQVKVGVFGDAVRLTGLVHSEAARAAAEDEAWRILGVDEVVNEIVVRPRN